MYLSLAAPQIHLHTLKGTFYLSGGPLSLSFQKTLVLVIFIVLLLAFAFQGTRGIWEPDEGYYLNGAAAMVTTGDWIVPQFNLRPFLDKPPMVYWGSAFVMNLFGINEWAARLAHAFWFSLTALFVGLLGASMWDRKTGLLAAFIYATSAVPFIGANIITPDTPLAFWLSASLFFFWKSTKASDDVYIDPFRFLLSLSLGMAILSKGPATLIFMGAMFLFLLRTRSLWSYLARFDTFLALVLLIFIGGSWYYSVASVIPGAFSYFWDNQVFGRLITEKYKRNPDLHDALVVYLPILLFGTLPWSLGWCFQIRQRWPQIRNWRGWIWRHPDQRVELLLDWTFPPLLVFCLASSKLPLYILPLFAPIAVASSRCLIAWKPEWISFPLPTKKLVYPAVWVLILVTAKLVMAVIPTDRDTRAVWEEVRRHLPAGRNEVVVVNARLHGLSFYSGGNVEWVTTRDNPYPAFVLPEPIEEEIHELRTSPEYHIFLVRDREYEFTTNLLKHHKVVFKEAKGPFNFTLLITNPAPPDDQVVRLVAMGDTRTGDSGQVQLGSALYHIDEERPLDGIILLGDNLSFTGDPKFFTESFTQPYDALIRNGVRFFAILGNHDVVGGFSSFQLNHPLLNMEGNRYYTRTFGDNLVQVFFLDSNTFVNDPKQINWFGNELDESKATWKIVAMHYPVYGKTKKYPVPDQQLKRIIEPILIEGEVDVVVCGHNHVYQRFRPASGVHHFTAGSGGKLDEGGINWDDPDLLAGNDKTNIALIFQFSQKNGEFTAIDPMENIIDSGKIGSDPVPESSFLKSSRPAVDQPAILSASATLTP